MSDSTAGSAHVDQNHLRPLCLRARMRRTCFDERTWLPSPQRHESRRRDTNRFARGPGRLASPRRQTPGSGERQQPPVAKRATPISGEGLPLSRWGRLPTDDTAHRRIMVGGGLEADMPISDCPQPQCPRRSLRVLRGGALTKAQSHLRLDKARIYLARHLPIEHPVPARMHLRGKFSQVRGFMVRLKTKSRDQICRDCCDVISAGIKEWQSHREASICRRQNLRRFGRNFEGPGPHSGRKLKTSGTIWPEVCQKHHSGTDFEGARRIIRARKRAGGAGRKESADPPLIPPQTAGMSCYSVAQEARTSWWS